MDYQTNMFRGQPDSDAIAYLQMMEKAALARDPRGYCVCTSEGKDSRIVGHLMRRAGVKHFYMHSITGIDPPELIYFQRRNFQKYADLGYETHDIMWRESMWQMMARKRVPPMRHMRYCCAELKERKTDEQGYAIISLGVRKHESVKRAKSRAELEVQTTKKGRAQLYAWDNDDFRETIEHCAPRSEVRVNPIAEWTDAMVWDYSREAKLDQCSLYGEGFTRLGCIGCPMAGTAERIQEFERWPKFEALYLKVFARMLEARKARGELADFTPREWFDCWMQEKVQETVDENQIAMELI